MSTARKVIIDDRREITGWIHEPGVTRFVIQNGMGRTCIALTDEAVHALIQVYADLQRDQVAAYGPEAIG